jgi:nucleotide-binding universal stress UspA family protein
MMKRILVPTDFSTPSLAAITQAVHYTQAVGGELLGCPRRDLPRLRLEPVKLRGKRTSSSTWPMVSGQVLA